jgi:hypothetical protein
MRDMKIANAAMYAEVTEGDTPGDTGLKTCL